MKAASPPTLDSPPAGAERSARTAWAFALLGTVQAVLIFTLAALAVPLPRIGAEYGLRRADLILLNSAYGLTFAGLLLLGARLVDRHGARRVLTAGLLVFAAASLAAPFAPGYPTLLTARFAQGTGAALLAPAAMGLLRALFPDPLAHGRALATWGGLSLLGATAGTLLSGAISASVSWRWTFAVPLLVAVAGLALGPRLLPATAPPPPHEKRPALDLTGALLATSGIILASYGLVLTDARAWSSAAVLVPLLTGAVLLGAFLLAELRAPDPLLPPRFLLRPRRALALAAIALTATGTAITFLLLSLHLQQVRGWSPLENSGAFVPFAVALLCSSRAAGPLIARRGTVAVTATGLAVGAVGLALLSATGLDPELPYALGLLPGLVLLAAGAAAAFAGAAVLAAADVPPRQTGLAGGVLNTAMELGPTVVLALLLTFGGDARPLAAAGAGLGLTALGITTLRGRPHRLRSPSAARRTT
ncbi:MFS transporter [Streptomyces sp. N2-109]|uniref:MFS transporter n=1 Tax=Streptomyces gossypii TaxID=2883101 RepID=A0ABT2JQR1_9ACTN|nr:MFS transporter [Streptomyces gossypii]MCT2590043.1 MFS transporter [Streptomyces gossypii]